MKCAIITPVGPGHSELYKTSCLPSIKTAATFNQGPFEQIIPIAMDDTQGRFGRSNRRNQAVQDALKENTDWVFFLDADDTMTPNAFQAFGKCIDDSRDHDAVWGLICELATSGTPVLREGQAAELSGFHDFLAAEPWLAVQIGGFVKTGVAAQHPFDESLNAGEDYKFFLDLWSLHDCRKYPEIFFVNHRDRHSTGPRAATGLDWRAAVDAMWANAVAKNEIWAPIAFDNIKVSMRITNPLDIIQATHIGGRFFDEDGLRAVANHVGKNARIVDIGANIGNHSIWFCKALQAEKVFPVEPNPVALDLLEQNLRANDIDAQIDRRGLGVGVSSEAGKFSLATQEENNLGATRLEQTASGEIEVVSLDCLLAGETIELLKIDAEGMEMDVLAGAYRTIALSRPVIWIEVLRENQLAFAQRWCQKNRYLLVDAFFHVHTVDYLAVPEEHR